MDTKQVDEFLEHHGVKGMKWGQRLRARPAVSTQRLTARPAVSTQRLRALPSKFVTTVAVGTLAGIVGGRIVMKKTMSMPLSATAAGITAVVGAEATSRFLSRNGHKRLATIHP